MTHNYSDFYELIFSHKRGAVQNLLECGIGGDVPKLNPPRISGASLRVWRDYFPNANIVGIDIASDLLFSEERIETYQCDQTDPQSIRDFLAKLDDRQFDIIIDDGLHEPHAGIMLFENCITRLSDGGIYVIEDVHGEDLLRYNDYFTTTQYAVRYVNLHRPQKKHLIDNSLVVITKPSPKMP